MFFKTKKEANSWKKKMERETNIRHCVVPTIKWINNGLSYENGYTVKILGKKI